MSFQTWHELCNKVGRQRGFLPHLTNQAQPTLCNSLRDKTMSTRNLENKLAYVGALVVLTAVLAAASSAFAAEPTNTANTGAAEHTAAAEAIDGAKKAMRESADKAAEALKLENDFALENQLADISSTLIAANK